MAIFYLYGQKLLCIKGYFKDYLRMKLLSQIFYVLCLVLFLAPVFKIHNMSTLYLKFHVLCFKWMLKYLYRHHLKHNKGIYLGRKVKNGIFSMCRVNNILTIFLYDLIFLQLFNPLVWSKSFQQNMKTSTLSVEILLRTIHSYLGHYVKLVCA